MRGSYCTCTSFYLTNFYAALCPWRVGNVGDLGICIQGDVDHIGLGGIGKHTTCPSAEAVAAERRGRQQRVDAEEQRTAKQSNSRGGSGSSASSGSSGSSSSGSGGNTLQVLEAAVVAADAAVLEAQAMLADAEASFAGQSLNAPKKSTNRKKKSYYADPDEIESGDEDENENGVDDAASTSAESKIEDLRAHVAMLDANARVARQRLESMVNALATQPLHESGSSSSSGSAKESAGAAAAAMAAVLLAQTTNAMPAMAADSQRVGSIPASGFIFKARRGE